MISTSVVIATYNGEEYIQEQLKSILDQVDANTEIIISDNGSTDKTIDTIKSFHDSRIKILYYNGGASVKGNFENALKHASGDIIFLCDQDDIWLPAKFSTCLSCLEKNDIVVTDCTIIDKYGKVTTPSLFASTNAKKGLIKNLLHNTYVGCCLVFKRKVLEVSLPFPQDIPMHDIWIGFIADLLFKPFFLREPLLLYRRHGNNFSATSERSKFSLLTKIKFRYNLIKYIPLLILRKARLK